MAVQIFSTGAFHFYTGTGNASLVGKKQAEYLGCAVGKPSIPIYEGKEQVFADISGSGVPFDFCWQGKYAVISVTLSRFDHAVFNKLMQCPDWINDNAGQWSTDDVGMMIGQENRSYPVWITFPRQAVSAMSSLKAGYRFWNCTLAPGSPVNLAGGTTHFQPTITWYAWPAFTDGSYPGGDVNNVSTSLLVGGANARWILYDHEMETSADYGATVTDLPSPT